MAQCPNCGATVDDGAAVCDSCGMALGEQGSGQGPGGETGGQSGGDQPQGGQPQQGQPPQGQPQGQPQQGQGRGGGPDQGRGQPQGQPRQGQGQARGQPQGGQGQPRGQRGQPRGQQGQYGQPQQGSDEVIAGLSRRQVLGIGGGVAVAAVGGFFLLGGGSSAGSTPTGTAEAFVNALNSGNAQRAIDLLHPNAQVSESTVRTLTQQFGAVDASVQGSSVLQQGNGQATVEVKVSVRGQTRPLRLELRTANGQWRVFSFSV